MMYLFFLIALWPRPDLEPVRKADMARVLKIEAEQQNAECRMPNAECLQVDTLPMDIVPGRFVVGFKPGCEAGAGRWVQGLGGQVVRIDRTGGDFLVAEFASGTGMLAELVGKARQTCEVRYVEPDFRVRASYIPNDPYFLQYQWGKWVMYADLAWDIGTGGTGLKVAVVDNGVEYWHPDLAPNFVTGELGYDFVGQDDDPKPDNPAVPEAFHGTHVSGIIAAAMDNNQGVAGWAQVQLLAVKVLNDSGSGDASNVASGIRWAADHGARVINMSLGLVAGSAPAPLLEACRYAADAGVVLVAAAGNEGVSAVQYPAALDQCICVGATDQYSSLADFSNYGPEQEVVAPGVRVMSTGTGGVYLFADGTSMAAPEVSGVAALVLAVDNTLSAVRVRAIIAASAIDKGVSGRDNLYGYGFVNAARALELGRMMSDGFRIASGELPRPTILSGNLAVPDWAEHVAVYDCQGRMVKSVRSDGGEVRLGPGSHFAIFSGQGRRELVKVLVVR